MPADYTEVTAPAPNAGTGVFAQDVIVCNDAGNPIPVSATVNISTLSIVNNTGFNAQTLTTTPLAGGGTFTSPSFDLVNTVYRQAIIGVSSDVSSANNGVLIQTSPNNIGFTNIVVGSYNSANLVQLFANTGIETTPGNQLSRYVRVVYINGAAPQGTFFLGIRFTL